MKNILLGLVIVLLASTVAYATPEQDSNQLLTDAWITAMNPLIYQAVTKYYGEPRSYALWDTKILQLKRERAHNPPNALETVTIHFPAFHLRCHGRNYTPLYSTYDYVK